MNRISLALGISLPYLLKRFSCSKNRFNVHRLPFWFQFILCRKSIPNADSDFNTIQLNNIKQQLNLKQG